LRPDEPGGISPDDDREDVEGTEPAQDANAGETPPPATWAGRQRSTEGAPPAGEGSEPDEPSGLTEDFDEVERELGDELDEVGDDKAPEATAEPQEPDEETVDPADELEEPEDEFAFEEDKEEDEEEPVPAAEPTGATVEGDTLALADQEQAREAAMAGLKARAAQHAAKTGTQAAAPVEAAPPAEDEPADEEPAVAAVGGAGEPPKPRALWARFLTASLLIVASMAAATSISLLVYLTDIAKGLSDNDALAPLREQLQEVDGGAPQTILILGSDKRVHTQGDPGRSDTTMLLRVDPDKHAIALLAIPRDLKVNIPGLGIDKFNAAYSYGGPDLTLRVVKQLTGVEVNHVVNINFTGFADAVNAIDCVYIDVDRHYFIPPEQGVAEIDVDAGYQRLCGLKALQYVRYRHDDNDLVRSARQQDFLREARQKLPPGTLIRDRNELLDIFTEYTTSDIGDAVTLLELLKTFANVQSAPVREVHFPADLGDGSSGYVTASEDAIKSAVAQFLGVEGTPGPRESGEGTEQPGAGGGKKEGAKQGKKPKPEPEPQDSGPAMIDATGAIQPYAQRVAAKKTKNGKEPMLDFPVYYPTQVPVGSNVTAQVLEASRAFPIDGPGNDEYRGYKLVLGIPGSSGFTEYYGVSGTDWQDPPILDNPSETRRIDGRDYLLFYDGDRLRLVGWKQKKASYWVSNSLLQTLDEDQLLAIAQSMRELGK
jgi:LCP family protein required for cell wall assembly